MINLSTFFKQDAFEKEFITPISGFGGQSLHEVLRNRGYNVIDRQTLVSEYGDLHVPINTVNLTYATSIPEEELGVRLVL